jgi:threonine/homoserine/homoserine lactone efflux protein
MLLGAAVFICNTINASLRVARWKGALIFVGFCLLAMALDFVLIHVFASATSAERTSYVNLASISAWTERVVAYVICAVGIVLALRFRQRSRSRGRRPVIIQTSEYTQSELAG